MAIRLLSVPDHMELPEFHQVMRLVLGWKSDLGYIVRVHGQEFNGFRRKTRPKALHELKLHRQERLLYVCDTLRMWEPAVRRCSQPQQSTRRHSHLNFSLAPNHRALVDLWNHGRQPLALAYGLQRHRRAQVRQHEYPRRRG